MTCDPVKGIHFFIVSVEYFSKKNILFSRISSLEKLLGIQGKTSNFTVTSKIRNRALAMKLFLLVGNSQGDIILLYFKIMKSQKKNDRNMEISTVQQ